MMVAFFIFVHRHNTCNKTVITYNKNVHVQVVHIILGIIMVTFYGYLHMILVCRFLIAVYFE